MRIILDALQIDSIHERVAAQLGAADQRYTDGRRRIVAALAMAGRPLTLPELLEEHPEIPQSTAYRHLDTLESTGLVGRLATGTDHARFELAEALLGHHHHLICSDCGSVQDIRLSRRVEQVVDEALARAATDAGFEAERHAVDLYGRCQACCAD